MNGQKMSDYYLGQIQAAHEAKDQNQKLLSDANSRLDTVKNDIQSLTDFKKEIVLSKKVIDDIIVDFGTISNYLQYVIIKGYPFDQDGENKEGEFQKRKKLLFDANTNLKLLCDNVEIQLNSLKNEKNQLEANIRLYSTAISNADSTITNSQQSYNQALNNEMAQQQAQEAAAQQAAKQQSSSPQNVSTSKPKNNNTSSGACFPKGTKVITKDGLVDIDKLVNGNLVLSYNEKSKKNEYKSVIKPIIHENEETDLITLYFDNYVLNVTGDHRFYVNNEWIEARKLNVNDELYYFNNTYVKIDKIESKECKNNYYNIEVEDNHNYFVSDKGVLVHNRKTIE